MNVIIRTQWSLLPSGLSWSFYLKRKVKDSIENAMQRRRQPEYNQSRVVNDCNALSYAVVTSDSIHQWETFKARFTC